MKASKHGAITFRSASKKAVYLAKHTKLNNREIAKKCGIREQTVCAAIARVVGRV